MEKHSKEFKIDKMAKVLGVCRVGYYHYLRRTPGKRIQENQVLVKKIKEIHANNREVYGSPRIHQELLKLGDKASRKRVAGLMKKEGVQSKIRKNWKTTTKSNPKHQAEPNYLEQNFLVEEPNKVWVSDIAYVATKDGWLYVMAVLDLFSRRVIGLSMGYSLETSLVINGLNQAFCRRIIGKGLIHHSDRGCQYTSKEFKELAQRHGMTLSMSGKGHCYDNAVAESFFHTLKTEYVYLNGSQDRENMRSGIFEYVEGFYNRKRLHSTLGYMTPEEFEIKRYNQRPQVV